MLGYYHELLLKQFEPQVCLKIQDANHRPCEPLFYRHQQLTDKLQAVIGFMSFKMTSTGLHATFAES